MCTRGLTAQCETTQVRDQGKGAALFGYTKLYGQVPGGQAQYLRVPQAQFGPVVVPDDGSPDERYLYLSDVLPTAWQAVEYAAGAGRAAPWSSWGWARSGRWRRASRRTAAPGGSSVSTSCPSGWRWRVGTAST